MWQVLRSDLTALCLEFYPEFDGPSMSWVDARHKHMSTRFATEELAVQAMELAQKEWTQSKLVVVDWE